MEKKNKSQKYEEFDIKKEKGKEIMTRIMDMPPDKAATMVGLGLISMLFLAMFGMSLYMDLLVPGDGAATIKNINSNLMQFRLGIASYLIVLVLDVMVAVGLYVILKHTNEKLASLQMWLRLTYTAVAGIGLLALGLLYVDAYSYTQLIAYAFFIPHIFILGYLVFKSGYIPRTIGYLLMTASFGYVILMYGDLLLPQNWLEPLLMIFMPIAVIAEISIGIWLLLKRRKLSEVNNHNRTSVEEAEAILS